MAHDYSHSRVFDVMKNVKESITNNYTSLQYLQTLDFFLFEALKPIAAECPSLFYNYLAKIVAKQTLKPASKYVSSDRLKLPLQLFNTLNQVQARPAKAFEASKSLYVNRGLLFGFIALFCNKLRQYEDIHLAVRNLTAVQRTTAIYRIEQQMGLRSHGALYPALQQVQYWGAKARWWKGLIVEKYTRMAVLQAQRTYKDFNHYVRLDDVVQIYLMVVNRAIDRCDARQGVLTTFVQNWFKSARGEVARMAEGQQDYSYEGLTEEHGDAIHDIIGVTLPDLSYELQTQLACVARSVDTIGLVRTSLGIPQFLTRSERQALEEFVYEPPEEFEYESEPEPL